MQQMGLHLNHTDVAVWLEGDHGRLIKSTEIHFLLFYLLYPSVTFRLVLSYSPAMLSMTPRLTGHIPSVS